MTNNVESYPVSGKELKRIAPAQTIRGDTSMLAPINGLRNKFVSTAVSNLNLCVSTPVNTPPHTSYFLTQVDRPLYLLGHSYCHKSFEWGQQSRLQEAKNEGLASPCGHSLEFCGCQRFPQPVQLVNDCEACENDRAVSQPFNFCCCRLLFLGLMRYWGTRCTLAVLNHRRSPQCSSP